jgi:hypothetical protein
VIALIGERRESHQPDTALDIENGSTLDLGGNSATVGALALDGAVIDGSLTASCVTATGG